MMSGWGGRNAVILAIAMLAGPLAGCAAPPTTTDPSTSDTPPVLRLPDGSPAPLAFERSRCVEPLGFFPHDAHALRSELPEGFDIRPYPGDTTGTMGLLLAAIVACNESADLVLVIPVEPPPALDGGPVFHSVALLWVTNNASIADVMRAWGMQVEHAPDLAVDLVEEDPALRLTRATASLGALEISLEILATGSGEPVTDGFSRTFAVRDRRVVGAMDNAFEGLMYSGSAEATLRANGVAWDLPPVLAGVGADEFGPFEFEHRYVDVDALMRATVAGGT